MKIGRICIALLLAATSCAAMQFGPGKPFPYHRLTQKEADANWKKQLTLPVYKTPQLKRAEAAEWARQQKMMQVAADISWQHEPWSHNDATFTAIRTACDRYFVLGGPPDSVYDAARKLAYEHPEDAFAQFKFGYLTLASFKGLTAEQDRKGGRSIGDGFYRMNCAPSPRSYEYDRLRFLLHGGNPWTSKPMRPLAYRLLKKNPNDYDVRCGLAGTYASYPEDFAEGISIINKLVHDFPDRPVPSVLAGDAYFSRLLKKWNVMDYRAARDKYTTARRLYPPGHTRIQILTRVVFLMDENARKHGY